MYGQSKAFGNVDHNKNHFQEQFEDSQMNMSANGEYSRDNGNLNEQGEPIQLMQIRPSGKINLDDRALDLIAQCDDAPVGFVCMVGKYRGGKSFLLNKLLFLQGRGFRVDPSVKACTQGIWMWSKPYFNQQLGCYLFYLDTEGTDSLEKGPDNDAKIFTLASLISSYFIFNSFGSIDERSIGQLNMVTQLSSNIIADEKLSSRDNEQHLNRYMPKFLWVLRDFTLELRDENGRRQTPNQYLQSVLNDQNSLIRVNEDVKRVRRSLLTYFKDRECITLVRPAKQQSDIQRLDSLPDHALRRQFIDGVNALREKIMRKAGPKMYDGDPLYGTSIASMIQSYVQKMNMGAIPNIKTAWQHIADDEGAFAYNRAIEKYNQIYEQVFIDQQPKDEVDQLPQILGKLRDETTKAFRTNLTQPNDAYQSKLRQFLHDKEKQISSINKNLNECRNVEILRSCVTDLVKNIQGNAYEGKEDALERDLQRAKDEYNSRAKGSNKGQILSEFLTNLYPTLLREKSKINDEPDRSEMLRQQYDQKIKNLEKQLKAERQAAQSYKNQATELPKPGSKKDPKGKEKDKNKTGCCGTGCEIM